MNAAIDADERAARDAFRGSVRRFVEREIGGGSEEIMKELAARQIGL